MCEMIRPACVAANFFASSSEEVVRLIDLRKACERSESTANENDCAIDWSRHSVMAITGEYGDLFVFEDDKVRKTQKFDEYKKFCFVEDEFNFRIPQVVIDSLRSAFTKVTSDTK